ncbi:MAG: sensitivity to high expression protein she9 [Bathelium mastoideum]|nr:MAG: sensitivity to high expression protein she9 [Bathelium mastoideum]
MKPLLRRRPHGLSIESLPRQRASQHFASAPPLRPGTDLSSTCLRCQWRAHYYRQPGGPIAIARSHTRASLRGFSSTRLTRQEDRSRPQHTEDTKPSPSESNLPSNLERRRTEISKRLSALTDSLLTSLSQVSHQVNTFTGTDYTPITTLRSAIVAQESSVRSAHEAVSTAKEVYDAARAQQISSQKEVVGLLERKSSWSATDLERYMALIRSEHVNEQDVATSLAVLRDKERELEEGRRQLEKMERQQYHEEQIWSDTIRRNSTWVTMGLMGVNILLLLVNIVGVEPWRRRKLIREVKKALDEKTVDVSAAPATIDGDLEKEIDKVVEPEGVLLETVEMEDVTANVGVTSTDGKMEDNTAGVEVTSTDGKIEETSVPVPDEGVSVTDGSDAVLDQRSLKITMWEYCRQEIFSERLISLRKVDVTYVALQGAATGVAVMGILFVILRPK